MRESYRLNKEIFVERGNRVHSNKYDYSEVEYINQRTKVKIICPIHGVFLQTPKNHMNGQGCPLCGAEYARNYRKNGYEDFVRESNKRFNGEYAFPNIEDEYENSHSKVTVIHLNCGTQFTKIACDHITSPLGGCPHCYNNISKPETEIFDFVKSIIETDDIITANDRTVLENNEIDIFIKNKNIGIELNGLYWHSELYKDKNYHKNKLEKCLQKDIRLMQFFEDEWNQKKEIVQSMIKNSLGQNEFKIYARKCDIREVSNSEANSFLNENHIQGQCIAKYRYGLYHNDILVSLMTFGAPRKNMNGENKDGHYEMIRFCNKLNINVVGGASKLFSYFIKTIAPREVISYCDRRFYLGNIYNLMGFKLTHISAPSYFYNIKGKRYNRFSLRKDILVSKYGCEPQMSEHDFCSSKGWYRVYDCGCLCFKWSINHD